MNEFLLIFRRDCKTKKLQPTGDQLLAYDSRWQDWFNVLGAENILAWPVQRLDEKGFVMGPENAVRKGPYLDFKESVGGIIIINAANYEIASKVASQCPVLELGGSVEVRKGN